MNHIFNIYFIQEREKCAFRKHLPETVEELRKFNARRKLKVNSFSLLK